MKERQYTKEWITQVRGKMNKIDFGKRIFQFKKNGTECKTVHRNTIGNWESGKTALPMDVETFLSLALFEYDQKHMKLPEDNDARNQRYRYVRKLMNEMIGLDLYCRHLHDALLIQVCRGIISFEEVLPLEKTLEAVLSSTVISAEERVEYAIERNTVRISDDLEKVSNLDEFVALIKDRYCYTFASANRTIGERIKQIYESKNSYKGDIPFSIAIAQYAPNYRDSYGRMFKSSFISRRWMIDFCIHLRFSRDEINRALDAAHMAPLSDDQNNLEYWYRETDYPIGHGQWYIENEEKYPHFFGFNKMTMLEKIEIMFLLALLVENEDICISSQPVDYLLEPFLFYQYGKKTLKELDAYLENVVYEDADFDDIKIALSNSICYEWFDYVRSMSDEPDHFNMEIYQDYRMETPFYYDVKHKRFQHIKNKEEAFQIYHLAALSYSILTGKYYNGLIIKADMDYICKQFEACNARIIYIFISHIFGAFLGVDYLEQTQNGKYFVKNSETGKRTTPVSLDSIQNDLWESIWTLTMCTI